MRVRPARMRKSPRYPTRDFVREHPEILENVPARWRNKRVVLAALGGTLSVALAAESGRVAPLFVHGEGRGSFGCMVVNPPVFLTEDEGRQVIQDEARKAGLHFEADGLVHKGAEIPVTDPFSYVASLRGQEKETEREPKTQKIPLVLDGYDREKKVAYELVSLEDFQAWKEKNPRMMSSVSSYDLQGTAEALRKGLAAHPPEAVVGVFYTPASVAPNPPEPKDGDWKAWGEKKKAAARPLNEEELRKQVRDFIQWLKAQGVI